MDRWYNTNYLVEVMMKKIALIVAIVYWAIIALSSLTQFSTIKYSLQDSLLKYIVTLAVHAGVAAVLFLLVWGIGSLFKKK